MEALDAVFASYYVVFCMGLCLGFTLAGVWKYWPDRANQEK